MMGVDFSTYAFTLNGLCELSRHWAWVTYGIDCSDQRVMYWYHPDYLGNTEFITDLNGDPYQYFLYSPWGESLESHHKHSSQMAFAYDSPYRFNAKELDAETGNYYYGARYYDPKVSVWLSVDQLASKFPSLTPYVFVADNPINLVDPDGRDIWEIDGSGNIVSHTVDKTQDAFYMVDGDGNRIEDQSITFDYGTIESHRSQSGTYQKRNSDGSRSREETKIDIYKVRGDENGTQLFEFFADKTSVEWSQAKTGIEGDKGLNFLTTGHIEYTEPGIAALINGQLSGGYTIRELNHNHPGGTAVPSGIPGFTGNSGDVPFAKAVTEWYEKAYPNRSSPTYNIYTTGNGYVPYNKNSKKEDYGY